MILIVFFPEFPVVVKAPKYRECQTLMTQFDDNILPQEGPPCHLPVQVSTAQQDESKNIL
jgi:hypothetical protein